MACSAIDVAAYVIRKLGRVDAIKLQKLVYYSQAYSLVWDKRPLFHEEIEAWVNGPVTRQVWDLNKSSALMLRGCPDSLDATARKTVDAIIEHYSGWTARELSDNTHAELPWRQARQGFAPTERCSVTITHQSMYDYYKNKPVGTRAILTNPQLDPALLGQVLQKGRLKGVSPSGILDIAARHVASSQRLEGVNVTSQAIREILDGRSST